MKRTPGTFHDHGLQAEFLTLPRAADVSGRPLHEITAAVSDGRLPVHEISGCKAVKMADLKALIQGGAAK